MPRIRLHYRWVVVALLFIITVLNYVDRDSLSFAISLIAHEFHLDKTDMGLVLGIFGVGYIISTLASGLIVDRIGSRVVLTVAVLFWSVAMFGTGLAPTILIVYISRVLLGVAEGPNFPGMTRALADWLPVKERGRAFAFALAAVPLGLMIGGPVLSALIEHGSWRIMFIILGFASLLWLPLWWFLYRNNPKDSCHVNDAELKLIQKNVKSSQSGARKQPRFRWCDLKFVLTNPTLLINYYAFFVFGYFLYFMLSWMPSYLKDVDHMDLSKVGWFSVAPWGLAVIILLVCGQLSDTLYKKTNSHRISRSYVIFFTQLLGGLLLIPVVLLGGHTSSLWFLSVAVAVFMGGNAAYYIVNVDIAKAKAGTALGIMDACFAFSALIAPLITGWLIQLTGHFAAGFVLLVLLCVSSAIAVLLFHHPERYGSLQS